MKIPSEYCGILMQRGQVMQISRKIIEYHYTGVG